MAIEQEVLHLTRRVIALENNDKEVDAKIDRSATNVIGVIQAIEKRLVASVTDTKKEYEQRLALIESNFNKRINDEIGKIKIAKLVTQDAPKSFFDLFKK